VADGKVYQFQFPYSSPSAAGAANISHQKTRENSNYYSTTTRHHSTVPAVVSNRRQQIEPHQAVNMAARMGWLRHVLTVLSVVIFLIGCVIIGYMAWVLATSVTISKFLDGTLIFTYVVVGLGFTCFFTGLIGWVGGVVESRCLVLLFLISVVLSMFVELGGIVYLKFVQTEFDDILQSGWQEVNQGTRNIIQQNLKCCGWQGPGEFAKEPFSSVPIDDSCYEYLGQANSGVLARSEEQFSTKKMKSVPCGEQLAEWFEENKITWVTILASVAALQVMCVGIAIYILSRIKRQKKLRNSRTTSKKRLYDNSSDSSAGSGMHHHHHHHQDYRNRI